MLYSIKITLVSNGLNYFFYAWNGHDIEFGRYCSRALYLFKYLLLASPFPSSLVVQHRICLVSPHPASQSLAWSFWKLESPKWQKCWLYTSPFDHTWIYANEVIHVWPLELQDGGWSPERPSTMLRILAVWSLRKRNWLEIEFKKWPMI